MSRGTCKTCGHWARHEKRTRLDVYGRPVVVDDGARGGCESGKFVDESDERTPKSASDELGFDITEDWGGVVFDTGPDFGCVHHKARD